MKSLSMNSLKKKIAAAIGAGLIYFISPFPKAFALPEIMPISEVKAGMAGEAYTVVDDSNDICSFGVEIIGTLNGGKGSRRLILARARGQLVESTGGVLQGMSGSPVYIDNRLVGAAAATFKDMDPYTFLITPIEDMLDIWRLPDAKGKIPKSAIDIKKEAAERKKRQEAREAREHKDKKISAAEKEKVVPNGELDKNNIKNDINADEKKAVESTEPENKKATQQSDIRKMRGKKEKDGEKKGLAASYVKADEIEKEDKNKANEKSEEKKDGEDKSPDAAKTLLFAAGFDVRGMEILNKYLAPWGFRATGLSGLGENYISSDVATVNEKENTDYQAELYPGSPIGVAVVHGDFSLGATGTVTAVENEKILAFGHSFTHKGNTNFFMTDATVVGTVNGQTDGMKIANIGRIIGRVNQDRAAGISGVLAAYPMTVPIRVAVEDKSTGRFMTFTAQCAYDEMFLPLLATVIPVAALGRTADNQAPCTVGVNFTVNSDCLPKPEKIERKNLFYCASDGGVSAFSDLTKVMTLIVENRDKESSVYGIDVHIAYETARRTAVLISAMPDKIEAAPGETVIFHVKVKPYRGDEITIDVPYKIPLARPEGKFFLDIHGGALVQIDKALADAIAELEQKETTADKLHKFLAQHANNELIVEPSASPPLLGSSAQKKLIKAAKKRSDELAAKQMESEEKLKVDEPLTPTVTNYIIENVIQTSVMVKSGPVAKEKKKEKIKTEKKAGKEKEVKGKEVIEEKQHKEKVSK